MTLRNIFDLIAPIPDDWEIVVYTDLVGYQGDDFRDIVRFNFTRQPQYLSKSVYKDYGAVEADPLLVLRILAQRPGAIRKRTFA